MILKPAGSSALTLTAIAAGVNARHQSPDIAKRRIIGSIKREIRHKQILAVHVKLQPPLVSAIHRKLFQVLA